MQTYLVTTTKIHKLGNELQHQPTYTSHLAYCEYFLFLKRQQWLCGKRFGSKNWVVIEATAYFQSLERTYFLVGIQKSENRSAMCIELTGDYVVKRKAFLPKKKNIFYLKSNWLIKQPSYCMTEILTEGLTYLAINAIAIKNFVSKVWIFARLGLELRPTEWQCKVRTTRLLCSEIASVDSKR